MPSHQVSGHTGSRPRVVIVSAILHPSNGGPPFVVKNHQEGLRHHCDVHVVGTAFAHQIAETRAFLPGAEVFEVTWPASWFRSPGFERFFHGMIASYDLVHFHMVWDHPVWAGARLALAAGKPYVITPHGTFMEKWRYCSPKKRLYRRFFLERILARAAAVHVLSEAERTACLEARITAPLAVIPNGLSPEAFIEADAPERLPAGWGVNRGRKHLVYMGRLWPEKGIDALVEAWAATRGNPCLAEWDLLVAGSDYRGYRRQLESRIAQLGVGGSVRVIGPVAGREKAALLQLADAFVQPSRSEALSMSLLEAMAAGLPCLYTVGCHLPILAAAGGGIETATEAASLATGLVRLTSASDEDRAAMGERAQRLASEQYSRPAVTSQLQQLYASILASQTGAAPWTRPKEKLAR